MPIPEKLYKYRKFDVRALNMICDHGLYYSDPRSFNDPLDCDFAIDPNISPRKLADLLKGLMGPERHDECHYDISSYIHYAEEEGGDIKTPGPARDYLKACMADAIAREIRDDFDQKGVLSFASTWNSVLMWSHYGDEHRGVCLEFDTTELPHPTLAEVNYDGDRTVSASDVYKWKMDKDEDAGKRVSDAHFYSKAPDWHYEKEWRDIGEKPGACGDYRITGVYFGFRCDYAVQVAVVKMLGIDTDVALWDVWMDRKSYELRRREVDKWEVDAMGMREPRSIEIAKIAESFTDLDAENGQDCEEAA